MYLKSPRDSLLRKYKMVGLHTTQSDILITDFSKTVTLYNAVLQWYFYVRRHRYRYTFPISVISWQWNGTGCTATFQMVHTVYPKKYAHGFVVLCFVVVMQSFIMNSHEIFIHIHQGCFAGTGAIVRLPQCQWSKPDGSGKISQCITTTKHSKAKTVCIFLGIYCIYCVLSISLIFNSWGKLATNWQNISRPNFGYWWTWWSYPMGCNWQKDMMTSSNRNIICITGPLCRKLPVTGEFPSRRPVTWSWFFFDLHLNKRLGKQSRCWWFEMPLLSFWHHCKTSLILYSSLALGQPCHCFSAIEATLKDTGK